MKFLAALIISVIAQTPLALCSSSKASLNHDAEAKLQRIAESLFNGTIVKDLDEGNFVHCSFEDNTEAVLSALRQISAHDRELIVDILTAPDTHLLEEDKSNAVSLLHSLKHTPQSERFCRIGRALLFLRRMSNNEIRTHAQTLIVRRLDLEIHVELEETAPRPAAYVRAAVLSRFNIITNLQEIERFLQPLFTDFNSNAPTNAEEAMRRTMSYVFNLRSKGLPNLPSERPFLDMGEVMYLLMIGKGTPGEKPFLRQFPPFNNDNYFRDYTRHYGQSGTNEKRDNEPTAVASSERSCVVQ